MLTHQTVGLTRVTVDQLGLQRDALPERIDYCDRTYAFWYYLFDRPYVTFDGAVYRSDPDALLFVTVNDPTER